MKPFFIYVTVPPLLWCLSNDWTQSKCNVTIQHLVPMFLCPKSLSITTWSKGEVRRNTHRPTHSSVDVWWHEEGKKSLSKSLISMSPSPGGLWHPTKVYQFRSLVLFIVPFSSFEWQYDSRDYLLDDRLLCQPILTDLRFLKRFEKYP